VRSASRAACATLENFGCGSFPNGAGLGAVHMGQTVAEGQARLVLLNIPNGFSNIQTLSKFVIQIRHLPMVQTCSNFEWR
jgi:hypothetical protein